MRRRRRYIITGLAVAIMIVLSGCTGGSGAGGHAGVSAIRVGPMRLVAFTSCTDALAGLRAAAKASVGPYSLPGSNVMYGAGALAPGGPVARAADSTGKSLPVPAAEPAYSGTNNHEAGVDEPDLVKTDGHRIVTVAAGVLSVIDASSRTVTGRLDLGDGAGSIRYSAVNLLLAGDHALLLVDATQVMYAGVVDLGAPGKPIPPGAPGKPTSPGTTARPPAPQPITGPRLLLVNLAGQPRVLASYTIDGALVDARQIADTARVVIRSAPRIAFPDRPGGASDATRVAANKVIIDHTGADSWLPRFETTDGGGTRRGRVPCETLSRPVTYTGANLLTVLTFNLGADSLGTGDGVSIAADGDTVYGTGTSLYIASDQRWQAIPMAIAAPVPVDPTGHGGATGDGGATGRGGATAPAPPRPRTEIYRFDISGTGPPVFAAGGSVPGYLVDQYAMSEWGGNLRIATTTGTSWAIADGRPQGAETSASAVYVLTTTGPVMRQIGHVDGLGRDERIYAVRFIGPVGYVVTFRQTDPLYTVDLSDPAQPRVRGAVQLTGYSAYLHPATDTRLIGIGQQADAMGHVGGTQVSLFNVADLAAPARLATFAVSGGNSDAEFDPHAFLYWPASHLVVVPLQTYSYRGIPSGGPSDGRPFVPAGPRSGVLILHIGDASITVAGFISQPASRDGGYPYPATILRSLVIDQTLWTVSASGAMATDLTSLRRIAWVPLS